MLPAISLASVPLRGWASLQKAAFDYTLALVLIGLSLPLLAVLALAVRLTSPGPVLFRQSREGRYGAPFTILKFRTMTHDESADQSVQARRHDPRVTWVGKWLRRTSLDELPQLFNVLRGEMSLVGPRPHLATTRVGDRQFHDIVPDYAARHRVKPGLTGLAQIRGLRGETRTEQQITDRVAHDLHYIETWSFGLDVRILGRTLFQEICRSRGNAY